jgi:hypothetical protein
MESRSACFGTKMVPCLWRVDLSFMNSVPGSSNIAKCSNILQDNNNYNRKKLIVKAPSTGSDHRSVFAASSNIFISKDY